jgi:hypothetical protein
LCGTNDWKQFALTHLKESLLAGETVPQYSAKGQFISMAGNVLYMLFLEEPLWEVSDAYAKGFLTRCFTGDLYYDS